MLLFFLLICLTMAFFLLEKIDAWGGDDDDLINNLIGSRPNSMNTLAPKPMTSIATGSAAMPPKPATGFVRNEEKAAEMARKREERRQVRFADARRGGGVVVREFDFEVNCFANLTLVFVLCFLLQRMAEAKEKKQSTLGARKI